MASLTVTVYKINGDYFPGGCERQISCNAVLSLKQNVSLELPFGAPMTCDDVAPDPVVTEILRLPNGDMWWVEQTTPSFKERCNEQIGSCCISIVELDNENPDNTQTNTLQFTPEGLIFFVDKDGNVKQINFVATGDPFAMAFFDGNSQLKSSPNMVYDEGFNHIYTKGRKWFQRTTPVEITQFENLWFGIAYSPGLNRWVATSQSDNGNGAVIISDDNGLTWSRPPATGIPANTNVGALAYGLGLFVAFSDGGSVWTSVDGETWTENASAVPVDFTTREVSFNGTYFLARHNNGGTDVVKSVDGLVWTVHTGAAAAWLCLSWGVDKWVSLSLNGTCQTSPDGETWTTRVVPGGAEYHSVKYGNGTWIAVAASASRVITSPDGITWTQQLEPEPVDQFINLAYDSDNAVFSMIAVQAGYAYRTADGVTWETSTLPIGNKYFGQLAWANGVFLATDTFGTGDTNRIARSEDGLNYTLSETPNQQVVAPSPKRTAFGAGVFVSINEDPDNPDQLTISSDGIRSVIINPALTDEPLIDIVFGDGRFVAITAGGQMIYSSDGHNWLRAKDLINSPANYVCIGYGMGKFVLFTDGEFFASTPDFQNYNTATSFSFTARSVAYGNGRFVAAGLDNNGSGAELMYSNDGDTWSLTGTYQGITFFGVAYGNGNFVAVTTEGFDGARIIYSNDGVNWSFASGSGAGLYASVSYGAGLFVAVGTDSLAISKDGVNFTIVENPPLNEWEHVIFGNGIFYAVSADGTDNKIMTSGVMDASPDATATAKRGDVFSAYPQNLIYRAVGTLTQGGTAPPEVTLLELFDRYDNIGNPVFDYTGVGQYSWLVASVLGSRMIFLVENNTANLGPGYDVKTVKVDGQFRVVTTNAGVIEDEILTDTGFEIRIYDNNLPT